MYQRQLADIAVHEKVGTASINQIKDQIADYNYTFYSDHRPGGLPYKKDGGSPKRYQDPFLWARHEMFFTSKRHQCNSETKLKVS